MNNIGIALSKHGAAIVKVEHKEGDDVVRGIEVLPRNLDAIADRVEELDDSEPKGTLFVLDSEGSGSALWELVGPPVIRGFALTPAQLALRARWRLYTAHGFDRQELVNVLLVAMRHNSETLHFAAGLDNFDQLAAALTRYEPAVAADGTFGPELVVALALAILPRPHNKRGRPVLG
jgi:hypothetical protein